MTIRYCSCCYEAIKHIIKQFYYDIMKICMPLTTLIKNELVVLRPDRTVVTSSNFIHVRIYMRHLLHYLIII